MLFSAIDIGSNASRQLFANAYSKNGRIVVEKATLVRIPTRLGEDVFNIGYISAVKTENLVKTVKAFKLLIDVYGPVDYTACATAAMREAGNSRDIISRIHDETGVKIRVISGLEEAGIIRKTNKIEINGNYHCTMYIDVGGGSTEISVLSDHRVIAANSFSIGTLRLLNNKVKNEEWKRLETYLEKYTRYNGRINIIGSGGNINKIKKLWGRANSDDLHYNELRYALNYLEKHSYTERVEKLGLRPDRADVIVPAAQVFIRILKILRCEKVIVPKIGLADGLIYQLFEEHSAKL